jgi:hypothetical protein
MTAASVERFGKVFPIETGKFPVGFMEFVIHSSFMIIRLRNAIWNDK